MNEEQVIHQETLAVNPRDSNEDELEKAIGRQVRSFRKQQHMTVVELSKQASMSPGMLSKVENGQASPSLATLHSLSKALNVPVTSFFRLYEEEKEAAFVKAGQGLTIERRGTRFGHHYQLLGHSIANRYLLEPYLISFDEKSDVFPLFQHDGVEFIYVLEGIMEYRHGSNIYEMHAGDSLYFDSSAPHGPEKFIEVPIKFITVLLQDSHELE